MTTRTAAAVMLVLSFTSPCLGQQPSRLTIVSMEFGGAALGECGVTAAIGGLTLALVWHQINTVSAIGPAVLATGVLALTMPAACAAGTCMVGSAYQQNGRFWPSYAGALIGIPVGYGVASLGIIAGSSVRRHQVLVGAPLVVAGVFTPSLGAVLGYNLSNRPPEATFGRTLPPRLLLPESRFSTIDLPDGRQAISVRFSLLRFGV